MILIWIAAIATVILVAFCTQRRPLWGLYLVMLSIPLSYKIPFENTPLYFLIELTLVPFTVVILSKDPRVRSDFRQSPFVSFLPFIGFIVLSSLWALSLSGVVKEVFRWGEFVLLGFTASRVIHREEDVDKPIEFLGWIGVVVSFVGIFQFLQGINQSRYRPGAAAFFGHPNPTAAFLSLSLIPMLGLLFQERRSPVMMKRLFIFFVLLAGLVFTFSRGVFLACILSGIFFLFGDVRSRLVKYRRAAAIVTGSLITLICLSGIPRFRQTVFDHVISHTLLDGREPLYQMGTTIYKTHPWLGLGAGSLKTYAKNNHLFIREKEPFDPTYGDLHNLFFQLAVETGSFGLLLFLGGILGFFYFLEQRKIHIAPSKEPLYRSLLATSLAFLIANLSGLFAIKGIHLEWAVLLGIQVAIAQLPTSAPQRTHS